MEDGQQRISKSAIPGPKSRSNNFKQANLHAIKHSAREIKQIGKKEINILIEGRIGIPRWPKPAEKGNK